MTTKPATHSIIEEVQSLIHRLNALIRVAETGEQWADICQIESEIVDLFKLAVFDKNENIEECARVADQFPGVYGNSPSAEMIRRLKDRV